MALQEYELDHNDFDPRNPYKGDERLPVEFYMEAIPDPTETEKAGRPIWKEVEAIKIYVNKDEITVHAPIYDTDKQRWPRQYAAWKQTGNNRPGMMGMPLDKWPNVNKAQVMELAYHKIFTVEQLSELPQTVVQSIPGLQQLQNQAKIHMEIARGEAPMHRLNKELEVLAEEKKAMKEQNAALLKRLEALEAKKELVEMASLQSLQPVLYIVNQALTLLSQPAVSGVYDQPDDEFARLMGAVINLAGILVNDANDWQSQRAPLLIVGDGTRTEFALPADLSRIVRDTGWSETDQCPVVPIDAQDAARITVQLSQEGMSRFCRIVRNNLVFITPPFDGDRITFEYIRLTWVYDADDNTQMKSIATKNGDIPAFDWLLMVLACKVKWLEAKRMDTRAAFSDFNDRLHQIMNNDILPERLSLTGRGGGMRYLDGGNVSDTGLGGP